MSTIDKMSTLVVLVLVGAVSAVDDYSDYNGLETMLAERRTQPKHNLHQTSFPQLGNYQVNAIPVAEGEFRWIARVVHSRTADKPHMCTAACIAKGIFVTAARCIFSLKINYTSVRYQHYVLNAVAFILPSNLTKQAFDDIGLIVVDIGNIAKWATITLSYGLKRTDDSFNWFESVASPSSYKVIGYAADKGPHRTLPVDTPYKLYKLEVFVGTKLCAKIYSMNRIKGFHVPCYLACTLQEFEAMNPKCSKYLGAEGAVVVLEDKARKLLGVATWGGTFHKYELPVGMAVANSDTFFKGLECARKMIYNRSKDTNRENYYQNVCN